MQQDAAVQLHVGASQEQPKSDPHSSPSDYTISVEQVRDHLRQKGLQKSKDTIQRWCRAGDLDCRKQGLLNRFFTTETSLKALEEKLLPDMIADQAGSVRLHEAANFDQRSETQAHVANSVGAHNNMQADESANAVSNADMQPHAAATAPASNGDEKNPLTVSAEVAELRAKVAGLTDQLEQAHGITKFLQEEIISSRGQRGDVVKIAEQMLATLETIAVGGRLDKPNNPPSPAEPVRRRRYFAARR